MLERGMILKTNMKCVTDNPELTAFLQLHQMFGLKALCTDKITTIEYDFGEDDREDIVSFADMNMLLGIPSGIKIRNATLYTHIVPESKLTQEVPADYPNSTIYSDDEEPVALRQKTWEEYTIVHPVEGGYLLRYSSGKTAEGNVFFLSDAVMRLWDRDFGVTVKRRAKELINAFAPVVE